MFDWILNTLLLNFAKMEWFQKKNPAQKMKFSTKDFISKCDQIRSFLRIWSHLLNKSFVQNFIFSAVELLHCNSNELLLWRHKLSFYLE